MSPFTVYHNKKNITITFKWQVEYGCGPRKVVLIGCLCHTIYKSYKSYKRVFIIIIIIIIIIIVIVIIIIINYYYLMMMILIVCFAGHHHLGCIIHNCINGSVRKPKEDSLEDMVIGDDIVFKINKIDVHHDILFIIGDVTPHFLHR